MPRAGGTACREVYRFPLPPTSHLEWARATIEMAMELAEPVLGFGARHNTPSVSYAGQMDKPPRIIFPGASYITYWLILHVQSANTAPAAFRRYLYSLALAEVG